MGMEGGDLQDGGGIGQGGALEGVEREEGEGEEEVSVRIDFILPWALFVTSLLGGKQGFQIRVGLSGWGKRVAWSSGRR